MEAATEKKRGRPQIKLYRNAEKLNNAYGAYNSVLSCRALQNTVNADYLLVRLCEHKSKLELFFMAQEGQLKHKGIAEQIGRMIREQLITYDQAEQLIEQSIMLYDNGYSSKYIECELRHYRMEMKKGR